ncbi:MAG: RDD family protein [Pseudomonadota bacterium]
MSESLPPATLLTRSMAVLYDSMVGLAILFIGTAVVLPLNQGEAFSANNPFYATWIFGLLFAYFGFFWTRAGQTLGMRAWRLRLEAVAGGGMSWLQVILRFFSALPAWAVLGAGVIKMLAPEDLFLPAIPGDLLALVGLAWVVLDQWPGGWRDRFSETRVVRLPKGNPRSPV